ncbi:MAG TPA: LuxR C-terminal-related transcriptional regulator, partial [Chloroflexota bacterium]
SDHLQALFSVTAQATLLRWIQSLSDAALIDHPALPVAGAWLTFQLGDLEKTRRFVRLLGQATFDGPYPLGEASDQSAVALLRAALGWDGVSQIGKAAQLVHKLEPPISCTYRIASLFLGASLLLRDRRGAARDLLEDAAEIGRSALDAGVLADALLALLDLEERRYAEAETRIGLALARLELSCLDEGLAAVQLHAARAWLEVNCNNPAAARTSLDRATLLLSHAQVVPWLTIYTQIVLGRVALDLDDGTSAAALLGAARRGLARHPDAGTLPHLLAAAERAHEASQGGGRTLLEPLTQAELRVLELAPTCLSIEEIGRTLSVSKNTIKTHLKAIYAKLSVASRSEAVERARELRLITPTG